MNEATSRGWIKNSCIPTSFRHYISSTVRRPSPLSAAAYQTVLRKDVFHARLVSFQAVTDVAAHHAAVSFHLTALHLPGQRESHGLCQHTVSALKLKS